MKTVSHRIFYFELDTILIAAKICFESIVRLFFFQSIEIGINILNIENAFWRVNKREWCKENFVRIIKYKSLGKRNGNEFQQWQWVLMSNPNLMYTDEALFVCPIVSKVLLKNQIKCFHIVKLNIPALCFGGT